MSKYNPDGPDGSAYNYDNYGRALTARELKTVGEITVLHEYHRLKSSHTPNVALQELLQRHDNALKKIARAALTKDISDFEDKLQHCRYAAMRAYEKFDIDRAAESKVKLSSYVYSCAQLYLHSADDSDAFIACPSACRTARSYLNGRYDCKPERKSKAEIELQIRNQDDIEQLRARYANLSPVFFDIDTPMRFGNDKMTTFAESLPHPNTENLNELIARINIESLIEQNLNARQSATLRLFSEGLTMTQIAEELGTTETVIRGTIRTIRVIMKRCFAADNKEVVGLTQNI
jgi:RNA polymerase sigma factor (sigma-70 family)